MLVREARGTRRIEIRDEDAPQPTRVRVDAEALARCLAATPVVAPVRSAVTSAESMIASRRPFAASNSRIAPWIVGRPRAGLPGKLALVLAAKYERVPGRDAALT